MLHLLPINLCQLVQSAGMLLHKLLDNKLIQQHNQITNLTDRLITVLGSLTTLLVSLLIITKDTSSLLKANQHHHCSDLLLKANQHHQCMEPLHKVSLTINISNHQHFDK